MEQIKTILFQRFNTIFAISLLGGVSLLLLMIRLKLTHSFFLLFLAWNLFLAFIPYSMTFWLTARKSTQKYKLLGWFGLWLLFLPNAPYIITDFIHLTHLESNLFILDTLVISAFAISGLLFYLISVHDMKQLFQKNFSEKLTNIIFVLVPFLCGFGIYLGRFLRWNSWDIIQRPDVLVRDILEIAFIPSENGLAWIVTIAFGIVLSIAQWLFNKWKNI